MSKGCIVAGIKSTGIKCHRDQMFRDKKYRDQPFRDQSSGINNKSIEILFHDRIAIPEVFTANYHIRGNWRAS
jgi:hypothetical protein